MIRHSIIGLPLELLDESSKVEYLEEEENELLTFKTAKLPWTSKD